MSLLDTLKRIITAKISRNYISKIDKFLKEFDVTHPKKSASQNKEIKKYQRIFKLRDNPTIEEKNVLEVWEDF
ncbi:MAG: CBU_0585 family protein [Gammaproteobacteria bacterium]